MEKVLNIIRVAAINQGFVVAECQAMKSRKPSGLNETRAGGQPSGECSPNLFPLLWIYR
ncbi:hypothetical protein [Runella rosea]|uniref:hypothetical protein n=1 Tax=Runella rosea TaxID=2259595 RepID=UPI0013B402FC|nr:hypothetical protein [Runella rosea]